MKHLPFIVVSLCLLSLTSVAQHKLKGTVVSVQDGDSFTFRDETNNKKYHISLYGIACPQKKQSYGSEAKAYIANILENTRITVEEVEKDAKGNIGAFVYLPNDRMVNEEMLSAGLAWHDIKKYKNSEWARLEQLARGKKQGLWKEDHVPPWEFKSPGFFDLSEEPE